MEERGENGASLASRGQRMQDGPIRDPPEQCLESLGFSAVTNENGECQSRILSPLRLPFRHPGPFSNREIGGVEPNVYGFDRKARKGLTSLARDDAGSSRRNRIRSRCVSVVESTVAVRLEAGVSPADG